VAVVEKVKGSSDPRPETPDLPPDAPCSAKEMTYGRIR
jgi:hypothetical protein